MKQIITLLLLLFSFTTEAQSIKLQGRVLASESGQPLPYVNIGIRNKNIGTASDAQGRFILALPSERAQDTLTFSAVGYQELPVPVRALASMVPLEVRLQEKVTGLQEVEVHSRKPKLRRLGVTGRLPVVWGNPDQREEKDIYEFANFIKVSGKPTELLSAHFYLTSTKLDSALFRINLYRNDNGLPGDRLVEQPIVRRFSTKEGWLTVDLEPFGIHTDEDFFLGIEYLPATGSDRLAIMLGGKLGGSSYSRKASLGSWEKFVGASLSGYVTVRQ
ncbi:carboxypeptidase-like regulatory domain-containing protein [Pontibacter chinhatensis]|uniref:CarboxypepD_reg-like domain-containing protein n=1 Tax=Pontibacter chinhatensis TaxID=1436961 RepID=A0A1I2YHC8_9BACT|nr:carboxypeptidase-like regulatory domain-containing protein [Pontibacter chinhatensis]SFH25015.1 CarboxypepD_reg-like domain-containing protein [Pontibacter chinhatensis]